MLVGFNKKYEGKKVLITGHTGFKGSWLSLWLKELGADVYGYALDPPTHPSLFEILKLENQIHHQIGDILDLKKLRKSIQKIQPDIIFHLAAQSLVGESYKEPLYTIWANTVGTVNVLEAVRLSGLSPAIIAVTTDKCYENKEWIYGYRENDPLGGYDPYSASKGAAEILIASWRNSFFNIDQLAEHGVRLASVRAGNVIGGGDWNKDHIMTNCIQALVSRSPIGVKSPRSTRPWQHVLEALGGYLKLGEKLLTLDNPKLPDYCEAYNFGPMIESNKTVEELVDTVIRHWGNGSWFHENPEEPYHESGLLQLSIEKSLHRLNWLPQWNFEETIEYAVQWYKEFENNGDMLDFTQKQLLDYQNKLNNRDLKKIKVEIPSEI